MVQASGFSGKYEQRPASCRQCGSPAWWNGTRVVSPVRMGDGGTVRQVSEVERRRARCSSGRCVPCSRTVYEPGDYPHRVFQSEVVVCAVCLALQRARTLAEVAARHLCGRDSVARWLRWVESFAQRQDLGQRCARLDPSGLPPPNGPPGERLAGRVLRLFERLADLLAEQGVGRLARPWRASGLTRLLTDQWERFGLVFPVTRASPHLRGDRGLLLA
jgi:hypothetical protein